MPHIGLQSMRHDLAPKQIQTQGRQDRDGRHHGAEDQRIFHVVRRIGVGAGRERGLDDGEDRAQDLAAHPAERGADLGRKRVRDLDEIFQDHGEEAECAGAQQRAHDDAGRDAERARGRKVEGDVGNGVDGHADADHGQVLFVSIVDRRDDGGGDEAGDDENTAGDARVGLRESVRVQNLVDEAGHAVEEADVNGEGDEDQPELAVLHDSDGGLPERSLGDGRRCARRCRRFGGNEE